MINIQQLKSNCARILVIFLIASQFAIPAIVLTTPKPAQAVWGVLDTNIKVADIPKYIEKVVIGLLTRVGQQYANKYLTKFVNKIQDKYRIKDFLFYDKYLTSYYISNLVLQNVDDPDLRRAYDLMLGITVTGDTQGYTGADPKKALLPQLKKAMAKVYINKGGIDPAKIRNPGSFNSDKEYFSVAQAFFADPPGFTEQNITGQFGEYQSSATTASQIEITVGNGLKAGRIIGGTCSAIQGDGETDGTVNIIPASVKDPVACAAAGGKWNKSLLDEARNMITNPTAFVNSHIASAFSQIFKNNYDPTNIYTQIGQALGDFVFNQLNLNDSAGVFNEDGTDKYNPNAVSGSSVRTVDLDADGLPDGQDNDRDGKLISPEDACYHGGIPPNCAQSSKIARSSYFNNLCNAADEAIFEMKAFEDFMKRNEGQRDNGVDFTFKQDAMIWAQQGGRANARLSDLMQALKDVGSPNLEPNIFEVNRYSTWLEEVVSSLYTDGDLDLKWGPGRGGGSFDQLFQNNHNMMEYIKEFRAAFKRCDNPDTDGAGDVDPPDLDIGPDGGDDDIPPPPDALVKHPSRKNIVAQAKAEAEAFLGKKYVYTSPECPDRFEIVKRTAWLLRGEGAGLLSKPGGNNCIGYSVDTIIFTDGYIYDIIGGGPETDGSVPMWIPSGCKSDIEVQIEGTCPDRYRPPIQPE